MTRRSTTPWLCSALLALLAAPASANERPVPRLVLAVTVDQLRADLPPRVLDRVGAGGFRFLYEHGVVYEDAQYQHAVTETAVGHATLFTGANPARHGIVANDWSDPVTGESIYSCKDEESPWVGDFGGKPEGRSPRNLLATTVGDQLVLATYGRAKVFGISIKDRSAILPAGHFGKAFWFTRDTGRFVSSRYYGEELPRWLVDWNATGPAQRRSGQSWTLSADPASYFAQDDDDRPFEGDVAGLGRTFPHPLGDASSRSFLARFACTPFADELLAELAEALIESEGLGTDDVPDLLAVSFSMTDAIGHVFGPSSLEAEDNLLRLDRTLAGLFAFVDARVGLDHTLVVLSADHGIAEAPEHMQSLGFDARRLSPKEIVSDALRQRLKDRFRVSSDLIRSYEPPYVYLDLDAVQRHGLEQETVERALADELMRVPAVAAAYSTLALQRDGGREDVLVRRVRNAFHPGRSGHVHVVLQPYDIIGGFGLAATHGSPWDYDAHVPVIFAGMGLAGRRVARPVGPEDVAPTIAVLLHAAQPSAAVGSPLDEVVDGVPRR